MNNNEYRECMNAWLTLNSRILLLARKNQTISNYIVNNVKTHVMEVWFDHTSPGVSTITAIETVGHI